MKTGQLSPWTYFLLPCEDALERWFIFLLTKILNIFYVVSFHLLPQVTHKQVCNFINCNKSTTQVSPKSWLLSDIRISYHSVDNYGNLVELWFQKRYPSRHRWVTGTMLARNSPCNAFVLHGALRDDPAETGKVSFWKSAISLENRLSLSHTFPNPIMGGQKNYIAI